MKRLIVVAAVVAIAVAQLSAAPAVKYKEAPALAELVKAGKLPPIEQRLPNNPLVVKGEQIGTYGGNWRMAMTPSGDEAGFMRLFAYEQLVRWKPDYSGVIPNVAEDWKINKDATLYTFYLRKGMKWSDGTPFTADDILFWYQDVIMNKELNPAIPGWLKASGEVAKVNKVDAYTVQFSFPKPNGLFIQLLAHPDAQGITCFPKHFAKQYHPTYTDKAKLDEMVKAEGFTTWTQLFEAKVSNSVGGGMGKWRVAGKPVLYAWVTEQPFVANVSQMTFTRNPYYWKVDPDGQQYPYVDKLIYVAYQDVAAMLLKATNGEIDFQMRHFNTLDNKAVLFENQAKGGYHFFDLTDAANNKLVVYLNLTHKDPALRQVFTNKDFRIGLSYAINRQEIIDTVFLGQGKPHQAAPLEGSPFYSKQLATQYLEFDTAKANQYLDKAGLKKGPDGMRLRPDGKPLVFVLEVQTASQPEVDSASMIAKYWKAVGINAEAKPEERTLLYTRKDNNDLDSMIWQGEGGYNPIMDPRSYFPFNIESPFGEAWVQWYMGSASKIAEEPPADIKKLYDKFEQVKATAGFDAQVKVMNELLQMSADQFLCMGIMTPPDQYGIVKNNFMNVPTRSIYTWAYPSPAPINPFTFYFKK